VKQGDHDADQQRECEGNGGDNGEEEERAPSGTKAMRAAKDGAGCWRWLVRRNRRKEFGRGHEEPFKEQALLSMVRDDNEASVMPANGGTNVERSPSSSQSFVIPSEARNLLLAGSISALCGSRFLDGFAVSE